MKAWYRVTSPEGYVCLELADGVYGARRKASVRPGYGQADTLRVELYKPYTPAVNANQIRAGIKMAQERGVI